MAEQIGVLIVDDHAVVREGLRAFLELQDGIAVVGEASDGSEAIEQAAVVRPDVILMDLVMPELDGLAAMRTIRARAPEVRVIVLTSYLDDATLLPALRAGAAGYLLKNAQPQEIARAVRAAHAGEALIDPVVAARMVETLAGEGREEPLDRLTPREREVLILIGRGFPNKLIARELGLSEKTVKAHVGRVLAKLEVTDRTQAAVIAVRAGLVDTRSEDQLPSGGRDRLPPTVGAMVNEGALMTETRTAHDVITDVVSTWRGIEAGTGSRGEWAFTVRRKEIGHLHGNHAAHFAFPKSVWVELKEQGRIEDHPVFPGRAGLAARRIENEDDVLDVIELLRLNYDRVVERDVARVEG